MSGVLNSLSVVYIPIQVIVCIVFLYQILGWSSFIGAITMVVLFPLPGWVANQMQYVEAEKLKQVCFLLCMAKPIVSSERYAFQTDSRVQTVTESKLLAGPLFTVISF